MEDYFFNMLIVLIRFHVNIFPDLHIDLLLEKYIFIDTKLLSNNNLFI